ncbi:hypothetical protein PENANT_c006G01646 [Penicillium antarcticum]|uniref:Uncharacterized protein n=1 Tax=Penicillium antarcticum TaxID=416450 RepID=A0A1V6QDD8_9EURO|nr:uncharacterized protein N7508_009388 [Penicillium antarcticum]KAJ5294567.1 hypothetical protein N7508_009388 [Penicillium antarcticum]OQD87209.1 hypothetical protein PENANT_c006G01646 [Penicillium antarcticum]
MATFLRLRGTLQPRTPSILRLNQTISSSVNRSIQIQSRTYAQKQDKTPPSPKDQSSPSPNHPIPSNKAQPTLRDGNQSPIADDEGNLKDDLPEDVKKHNQEMEDRYDKPYNHMGDKGNPESNFESK